jgi:hypothetical protein
MENVNILEIECPSKSLQSFSVDQKLDISWDFK